MSSRLVPRLVLVGLLAVSSAAPVVAQEGGFIVPLVGEPLPPASKPGCGLGDCCRMPAAAVTTIGVKIHQVRKHPDVRLFSGYDITGLGTRVEDVEKDQPGSLVIVGQECRAPQPTAVPSGPTFTSNAGGTLPPPSYAPAPVAQPVPPPMCTPAQVLRLKCDGPPDSMKQMAVDVFGELLIQSGVSAPPQMPTNPKAPASVVAPCYPERHQFAAKQVTIETFVSTAKPNMIGTWYRDLGKRRCVVEVAADHMTFTITDSYDDGDKSMSMQCIITAEYHMTRDGTTAVGLITSVDFRLEGDTSDVEESNDLADVVAKMQQAMEDKPFAMTCRVLGGSLVIGNVRMPLLEGQDDQPAKCIGGRYTSVGNKPMPKVKTVKSESKASSGMTLPSPRYLEHFPQYPALAPALPSPGELFGEEKPSVIPASETTPPMMVPPEPPVPMMEPPTPPSFSANEEPKPEWQPSFGPRLGFKFGGGETPVIPPTAPPMPTPSTPPTSGGALTTPPSNGASSNTTSKGSALRNVMTAKPNADHRQIFNFPMGLFGSQ